MGWIQGCLGLALVFSPPVSYFISVPFWNQSIPSTHYFLPTFWNKLHFHELNCHWPIRAGADRPVTCQLRTNSPREKQKQEIYWTHCGTSPEDERVETLQRHFCEGCPMLFQCEGSSVVYILLGGIPLYTLMGIIKWTYHYSVKESVLGTEQGKHLS